MSTEQIKPRTADEARQLGYLVAALAAEVTRLLAACEPFLLFERAFTPDDSDDTVIMTAKSPVHSFLGIDAGKSTVGDVRKLRAAISKSKGGAE